MHIATRPSFGNTFHDCPCKVRHQLHCLAAKLAGSFVINQLASLAAPCSVALFCVNSNPKALSALGPDRFRRRLLSATKHSPCSRGAPCLRPASTFRYGSHFCTLTVRPLGLKHRPNTGGGDSFTDAAEHAASNKDKFCALPCFCYPHGLLL